MQGSFDQAPANHYFHLEFRTLPTSAFSCESPQSELWQVQNNRWTVGIVGTSTPPLQSEL